MLKQIDIELLELSSLRGSKRLPAVTGEEIHRAQRYGIINPVVAIPKEDGKRYEIISGEKSWLLAQRAMIHRVPVYVREDIGQNELRELALTNDDRPPNPIDDAIALRDKLQRMAKPKKSVLARMEGMTRTALSHKLRLLDLAGSVQELLREGKILEAHARPLVGLERFEQERIARMAAKKKLSVREVKQLVRKVRGENEREPTIKTQPVKRHTEEKSSDIRRLENELSEILGARVLLEDRMLVVDYAGNLEILEGILEKMGYQFW